jgi:hypothetical protein
MGLTLRVLLHSAAPARSQFRHALVRNQCTCANDRFRETASFSREVLEQPTHSITWSARCRKDCWIGKSSELIIGVGSDQIALVICSSCDRRPGAHDPQ